MARLSLEGGVQWALDYRSVGFRIWTILTSISELDNLFRDSNILLYCSMRSIFPLTLELMFREALKWYC